MARGYRAMEIKQLIAKFGHGTLINKLKNLHVKCAMQRGRLVFLLKCRSRGLLPRFIVNSTKKIFKAVVLSQESKRVTRLACLRLHRILLNLSIGDAVSRISNLRLVIHEVRERLFKFIDNLVDRNFVVDNLTQVEQGIIYRNKPKLLKKFQLLLDQRAGPLLSKKTVTHSDNSGSLNCFRSSWFKNCSNILIPQNVKNFLALGPNFSLTPHKVSVYIPNLLTDVEYAITNSSLDDKQTQDFRAKACNIFQNHLQNTTYNRHRKFLPRDLISSSKETASFLRDHHDDLIITRSDKGNFTVALSRSEYFEKLEQLFSCPKTYKIVSKCPVTALQKRANDIFALLVKSELLTRQQSFYWKKQTAVPPKAYGLLKFHKPNWPLRPIISDLNGPLRSISKFISPFLKPFFQDNPYDVRNSIELKDTLSYLTLGPDDILISLDVSSLFTNVPVELVLDHIYSKLSQLHTPLDIPDDILMIALKLITNNSYFVANGKAYRQLRGVPMGGSISVDLANICMNILLDDRVSSFNLIHNNAIKLTKKYVDDLFFIINKKYKSFLLPHFNNFHNDLQFTMEEESNNSLPFLDMLVIRNLDGSLITDWYHKQTYSGRLLNYFSSHPQHQISNVARNFIQKIFILSHPKFLPKNLDLINLVLSANDFPKQVIDSLIKTAKNPKKVNNDNVSPRVNQKFHSLTYIPGLTEKFIYMFKAVPNVRFGLSCPNKISRFFSKTKDRTPQDAHCDLVYQIPCLDCSATYVGETKRKLGVRIKEHSADVRKFRVFPKDMSDCTALCKHMVSNEHRINTDDVKILDRESMGRKRKIKEAIHIHLQKESMNFKKDVSNFDGGYKRILDLMGSG